MKETLPIIELLEDFIFSDHFKVNKNIQIILKKITSILKLNWSVVYIIPRNEDFIIQEKIITSHKQLRYFSLEMNELFQRTYLYQLKKNRLEIFRTIHLNSHYPQYKKNEKVYAIRKNQDCFFLLMEFGLNKNIPLNKKWLLHILDFIMQGLMKRYKESYYENKLKELLNLIEISKLLNSTIHLDHLLDKLFTEVKTTMNTEGCSLMLTDKETGALKFKTVKGKKGDIIKEFTIPSGRGIAGWIVKNKKTIIVNDVKHDKRFYKNTDIMSGFKTKNLIGAPLIANNELIGVIEAVNRLNDRKFTEADKDIFLALANQAAIAIQNARYYNELQELFLNTVKSLSAAIDAKDKYTIGHSERVTKYSILLAKELQLDSEWSKRVELAGLLHDIGKIGVIEKILQKPDGLSPEEFEIIKQHPVIGEGIIRPIPQLKEILSGIRNHHERWDGKGYPDQLSGENIPLLGRIISLSDTYDAMTSDRPYRKGLNLDIAINEIQKGSGTQFDPEITKVFIEVIKKFPK